MARKPKADRGASVAAVEDDTPAPPRRGRGKAPAAEPDTALGDDLLATALADDAPASGRRRSGPKAKASPDPVPLAEPTGKRSRRSRQMASPEPEAPEPEMAETEAAEPDEAASMSEQPSEAASLESLADSPAEASAPASASQDQADGAKPAAQWDGATETATFDWPAIESTAAQAGPNQVMAKLLIAARAQGANSRWPL